MHLVVFGLAVSSSWGNGHATLWRGLIRALTAAGHRVTFFERDVDWYARHRDSFACPGFMLTLYTDWPAAEARAAVRGADVAMVTSYCPDARAAAALIADAGVSSAFYDLDTPVTLAKLSAGASVPYLPEEGLGGFDLVLSYTGGRALTELSDQLGARRVAALYGHVDPAVHMRVGTVERLRGDLSYLGTWAADRQPAVERLFLGPARARPESKFVLGGSGYPADFAWEDNVWFVQHMPPPVHAAFYSSSRITLNVTRADMAAYGWCPSGRLFEAAACGCPVVTDSWEGLDAFFEPGAELIVAETTADVLAAMESSDAELARLAEAARARVLAEHTSAHRAAELLALLERPAARAAA